MRLRIFMRTTFEGADLELKTGTIILLNGVSSSGKTTLAKELARQLSGYFPLSLDEFALLIDTMEDSESGRLIPVETEYFFHRTIAVFADRGVNLIVDTILHDDFTRMDCLATLAGYPVLFVGVHCSPEELRRRELARGNRAVGQAEGQLAYVHNREIYDVEVHSDRESTAASVIRIMDVLRQGNYPKGWERTRQRLVKDSDASGVRGL